MSSPDLWDAIVLGASGESALWAEAALPTEQREQLPVFSPLAHQRYALGLETIYEGYLVHYGRPRLFQPRDGDEALLLGDYLYAHGLVRIAELGEVEAIEALAALISRCAHLRAESEPGDGDAWAETAGSLGSDPKGSDPEDAAREVALALDAHARRVG